MYLNTYIYDKKVTSYEALIDSSLSPSYKIDNIESHENIV